MNSSLMRIPCYRKVLACFLSCGTLMYMGSAVLFMGQEREMSATPIHDDDLLTDVVRSPRSAESLRKIKYTPDQQAAIDSYLQNTTVRTATRVEQIGGTTWACDEARAWPVPDVMAICHSTPDGADWHTYEYLPVVLAGMPVYDLGDEGYGAGALLLQLCTRFAGSPQAPTWRVISLAGPTMLADQFDARTQEPQAD